MMHKILQQKIPEDFVIGVGESHSVKEFVNFAFSYAGLDPKKIVKIDKKYFRPTEVEKLVANPKKARKILNWKPKIKFEDLVKIMVDADMEKIGLKPIGEGIEILEKKYPNRWWKVP
jgi:GDPmannose 4,6-dehydratase